jgi:hypothetical protein
MHKFISFSYWFAVFPGNISSLLNKLLAGTEIILILAAIFLFFFKKRAPKNIYRRIWRRLFNFFLANSIIGVFIWFFMYEAMPLLSSRFWLLAWIAGDLAWAVFIIREAVKLPEKQKEFEAELLFKKYLP